MLTLKLRENRTDFKPGETIHGSLAWSFSNTPKSICVRFIWYTEGKGTQDVSIVAEHKIASNFNGGEESFSFSAPKFPLTIHGQLISVLFAIEAISKPEGLARTEITIANNEQPITLPATPEGSLKRPPLGNFKNARFSRKS